MTSGRAAAHARERNSLSIFFTSTGSAASPVDRHCWSPDDTMAKPARSSALETAARLSDDVLAVAALLEHPEHAGELSLGLA